METGEKIILFSTLLVVDLLLLFLFGPFALLAILLTLLVILATLW